MTHGTMRGVWRHNNRKEPQCGRCLPLFRKYQLEHPPRRSNAYDSKYDEALNEDPPQITWRRKSNGVWVAVKVLDPHAESSVEAQAERMRRAALAAEHEQARKAAARIERRRVENTSLMQAARAAI